MKQKHKILWLEDSAMYDLQQLSAPVILDGSYDLVIAENVSDGIAQLQQSEFEAIIVDIRIPPGDEKVWIDLYERLGRDKISARLGLQFLYTVLGHPDAKVNLGHRRPSWIKPAMLGVLSVESQLELDEHMKKLGITVYHQKRAETPETMLLELIDRILSKQTFTK